MVELNAITRNMQGPRGMVGLQMKLLAAQPGSPLFKCLLNGMIVNVKERWMAPATEVAGPVLLMQCYQECIHTGECTAEDGAMPATLTSVAITYRDTRNAVWPYAGLTGLDSIGRTTLLAWERPRPHHFHRDGAVSDVESGLYQRDCALLGTHTAPPTAEPQDVYEE